MSGKTRKVFEKIGRFLFQKNRMPIFLFSLSIGPLVAAFFLYHEKQSFNVLEETSSVAMRKAKSAFQRKTRKEAFLTKHENSDPYFLDKEIESLCFLNQEKNQLKGWLSHPAISNKDKLYRRIHFLENGENRLSFSEDEIQVSKTCKETVEKQRYPIEIDASDLQKLLSIVEESPSDHFHNFHTRGLSEKHEMCSISPKGIAPAISKVRLDADRASQPVPECGNCESGRPSDHFHNFHTRGPSEKHEMCSISPKEIAPAISKARLDADRASQPVPECGNCESGRPSEEMDNRPSSLKGRPQLLICNFSMTKKNTPLQNEVFEITMDLLKREFLSK